MLLYTSEITNLVLWIIKYLNGYYNNQTPDRGVFENAQNQMCNKT